MISGIISTPLQGNVHQYCLHTNLYLPWRIRFYNIKKVPGTRPLLELLTLLTRAQCGTSLVTEALREVGETLKGVISENLWIIRSGWSSTWKGRGQGTWRGRRSSPPQPRRPNGPGATGRRTSGNSWKCYQMLCLCTRSRIVELIGHDGVLLMDWAAFSMIFVGNHYGVWWAVSRTNKLVLFLVMWELSFPKKDWPITINVTTKSIQKHYSMMSSSYINIGKLTAVVFDCCFVKIVRDFSLKVRCCHFVEVNWLKCTYYKVGQSCSRLGQSYSRLG